MFEKKMLAKVNLELEEKIEIKKEKKNAIQLKMKELELSSKSMPHVFF